MIKRSHLGNLQTYHVIRHINKYISTVENFKEIF